MPLSSFGEDGSGPANTSCKNDGSRAARFPGLIDCKGRFGWGGRIRTYTIRINSAVSYRLDHAPTTRHNIIGVKSLVHVVGRG
jgi:hypothetical protein